MLTERQLEVVLSVVYEFIQSGENVGSRTVSKRYLTGHSAATIRNEMADLEEMGYLVQPHSSSGRIPTTRAYRLYVDAVLQRRRLQERESGDWLNKLNDHRKGIEGALSSASELLSQMSNYVGVAGVMQLQVARLNKIDFIRVDSEKVLLLVILEGGIIHHRIIQMPYDISQDSLGDLGRRINTMAGHSWSEVKESLGRYIYQELGEYANHCRKALLELDSVLSATSTKLFTGSVGHLLNLPDFQDLSRLKAIFSILEQEESLSDLVRNITPDAGVKIVIGEENELSEMKDCSLVVSSFGMEGQRAVLGIIGPKRMNYERVLSVLDGVLSGFLEQDDLVEDK